ncbi:hypothetical protein Hanom_Chr14g01293731 [Helianthus anomalus]
MLRNRVSSTPEQVFNTSNRIHTRSIRSPFPAVNSIRKHRHRNQSDKLLPLRFLDIIQHPSFPVPSPTQPVRTYLDPVRNRTKFVFFKLKKFRKSFCHSRLGMPLIQPKKDPRAITNDTLYRPFHIHISFLERLNIYSNLFPRPGQS